MPTPSERESDSLDRFLGLRDSLRTTRRGHGGFEVCEALTESLDGAIADLARPLPADVAIVAIGGYGRGELSLYSDIDLMLLHRLDDPAELAASLFRPLWDAKLRVGHSVRTIDEAVVAAKERVDTHTTLLTGRLVAGDPELFESLRGEIRAVTAARPLRRHLVAEERERRQTAPYLLMATDVKLGRGGLRTLHGFEWEQRREELIGRFSTDLTDGESAARESLLRIRNALHAVTGRSHDTFSADLREPVARWLGLDPFEAAEMLVQAMQTVDRLASRRWPEVVEERPRGVWARLVGKAQTPRLTSEPSLDELAWLLETGELGRSVFDRIREAGLLDRILPEWEVVDALPQMAPFHEHPVAAHLWRATDEMLALTADEGHYGRVAGEVGDRRMLLLTAFLHDIGKGHGGDHAVVGSRIARSVCDRLGVEPEDADLVEGGVRHHLLLARTATRRDLDDPAVIDEIAATVGGLRLLQVLYLLTVADSRATGPTVWGEWKATLLRTLFARCAARFGGDRPAIGGTTRGDVLAAAGRGRIGTVESHLDGMPAEYLRSASSDEVLWHVDLIRELDGPANLGLRALGPVESAVVVGVSRPGFRRRVAEVFAANGIDVLEARMSTRVDGMVVDAFKVRDDRTGGIVEDSKWASVRGDLEAGLAGTLDTGSKVAARAAAYGTAETAEPSVAAGPDAATGDLVVTIKCEDGVGRLAQILGVLGDCGLGIRLAKIDSREGEVVDTFHVADATGADSPGELEELERRIAGAISS